VIIKLIHKKIENEKYPSLCDIFQLGDRVKRTQTNNKGIEKEYSGIIMEINDDSLEIYWDKINGIYDPKKIDCIFDNCQMNDIFNGNENFTPIKKEKYILINIIKNLI
jgi:hypothetical protein